MAHISQTMITKMRLTNSAVEVAEQAGMTDVDVASDYAALCTNIDGIDAAAQSLLDLCLDGAEGDARDGWLSYVDGLVTTANVNNPKV